MEGFDRNRAAEEKTLELGATETAHHVRLFLGLDALGRGVEDLIRDGRDADALGQRAAELERVGDSEGRDVGGDEVRRLGVEHLEAQLAQD